MDILSVSDVADILKLPQEEVAELFQEGHIPGRRLGRAWFTTRRQLIAYIEGAHPEPGLSQTTSYAPPQTIDPNIFHNWECDVCHTRNPPERVECANCRRERIGHMINFFPNK